MEAIHENGTIDLNRVKPAADVESGYTYFRDGDVLVAKITPCFENGKGAVANGLAGGFGFGTTELTVLRPQDGLDRRFLRYVTVSHEFRKRGEGNMFGTGGQKRVPDTYFKDFPIALPPRETQMAIVMFLDKKLAFIDALIAKKERLIDLLQEKCTALINRVVTRGLDPNAPLRDSGFPWQPFIPSNWQIVRNRFLFRERDERGFPELPILEVSIHTGVTIRAFSGTQIEQRSDDLSAYKRALKGDIVFNKMRMWQGAVGVAPIDGLVSPDYTVATVNEDRLDPHYFVALCRTEGYRLEINRHSHGIVDDRNRLYWDGFADIATFIPPRDQQVHIVRHFETASSRINEVASRIASGIEKMKEYRTALISAAVTGKINCEAALER